jgi:cell division protein FtsB
MRRLLARVPRPFRNRYALAVVVLIGWILFFDQYDAWTTWKTYRELERKRDQQEWYRQEITQARERLHQLTSDKSLLEKFARERYLMKRDNEEIFVLVAEQK